MAGENLLEEFHAREIEEGELEAVFLQHFHGAMSPSSDEIVYPDHNTQYALKLRYDHKEGLSEITPGPMLDDRAVETLKGQIQSELLAPSELRVARAVFFTSVPVEGYFRYGDLFQILPVPPEAPRPQSFLYNHHPFILEFRFRTSSNPIVLQLRRAFRERELELLAAGLLRFSPHARSRAARHHWVLPTENLAPGGEGRSAYLQELYTWPGLSGESGDFTVTSGISKFPEINPQEYYTRLDTRLEDRRFEIPSNLTNQLDCYFSLSKQDRERFRRSCYWFQHARKVSSESRSATFTALISAVEALIPSEKGGRVSEKCGRVIKGSTHRFSDFVERFALGSGASERDRSRFYGIRSALSHGGTLLHSDRFILPFGFTPDSVSEWEDVRKIWQLVRVILVNWLQAQKMGA